MEKCRFCTNRTNRQTVSGLSVCDDCEPAWKEKVAQERKAPSRVVISSEPFEDIHTIHDRTREKMEREQVGAPPDVKFWDVRTPYSNARVSGWDRDWTELALRDPRNDR